MVENLFEQNVLWAVLTAVLWAFAARGARRLATRPTAASIRRRARLGLILLGCALLALAVRAGLAVALAGAAGWLAGADYVLFGALPLLPAALAVGALTVPAYLRVLRRARDAAAAADPVTDGPPAARTDPGGASAGPAVRVGEAASGPVAGGSSAVGTGPGGASAGPVVRVGEAASGPVAGGSSAVGTGPGGASAGPVVR
ncbi:hypothetical protein ACIF9R_15085, partial [Streptomyces sp. NPDC086080]